MSAKRIVVLATLALLAGGQAVADTRAGRDAFRRADFATALKELQPEADKGDPEAMAYVAKMYQAGLGVKKDVNKAVEIFARAAEAGSPDAQYSYGFALALGDGAEQNIVEGLKWLYISALSGNIEAREQVAQLSKAMPREVVSQARTAAFEWNTAHGKKDETGNVSPGTTSGGPDTQMQRQ